MWCRDCQQDVPAVAKSMAGPLVCTRCETELEVSDHAIQAASAPVDSGVELDGLDRSHTYQTMASPWRSDEAGDRLRRIGNQLRTAYRHESTSNAKGTPRRTWGPEALAALMQEPQLRPTIRSARRDVDRPARSTATSRFISLLLFLGVVGFIAGVFALVWSAAFGLPNSWQWGMTATIAGEGVLIVGLTWMALRLWHNSRRLNRQIDGVDRQINQLEHLTGSLAAGRMTGSQYYYSHFNQGASGQMLLADLQGQVEQLSTRLAG